MSINASSLDVNTANTLVGLAAAQLQVRGHLTGFHLILTFTSVSLLVMVFLDCQLLEIRRSQSPEVYRWNESEHVLKVSFYLAITFFNYSTDEYAVSYLGHIVNCVEL